MPGFATGAAARPELKHCRHPGVFCSQHPRMSFVTQHPAFWLALAFLALLAANLYVFLTRNWEESLYPVDYARLNYALDVPTIRQWKIEGSQLVRLEVAWTKQPASWQLFIDGQAAQILPGNALSIPLAGAQYTGTTAEPLEKFEHRYKLRPLPDGTGPDLDFTIVAIAADYYRTRGMHFPADLCLIYTDIPAGKYRRHPVSYWVDDYRYLGAETLTEVDRVVRHDIGVRDTDDTFTRMDKVMRYQRTQLVNAGGVPKDAFRWMNPWEMFQEMAAGTGKGWCTQNAQIFTFLANRAGIPTRFVFGANTVENKLLYNGHSWAECWVKEQGRWAHVDPTHTLIAIQDKQGQVLNTADLMHLNEHETYEGVTARIMKDWHWKDLPAAASAAPGVAVNVPYGLVNLLPRTHLNRQSIIKYRRPPNVEDTRDVYSMLLMSRTFTWTNFKRYLYQPTLAYSKLPTDGVSTYVLRQSLFVGLVITAALWVASLR